MSKIRAEFHTHTRYSKDSILNKYFILLMCKLKKIKVIAITDHNEIKGAIKYKRFLKRFNIDVIIGEEIMTKNGEIIGLFLNKKIEPGLSVKDTIKELQKQKAIIYVPHPYDEKRKKTVLDYSELKKNKSFINCIEIYNGRNIKKEFSKKQEEIQQEMSLTPIIGSDAHTFFELGRNFIIIDYIGETNLKNNFEDIINNASFHKKKCLKVAHMITKIAKGIKMIEKGDLSELFRTIFKRRR